MTFIASDFSRIASELKRIETEKAKVLAAPPPDEPAAGPVALSATLTTNILSVDHLRVNHHGLVRI